MLTNKGVFTERQKEIITRIGHERRESISHEKKKLAWGYCGVLLIFIIIAAVLVLLDNDKLPLAFAFVVMWAAVTGMSLSRKIRELKYVSLQDDYNVGLFFADKDHRVIGNAQKRLKAQLIPSIVMSVLGLMVFIVSFVIVSIDKPPLFDSMIQKQGMLSKAVYVDGMDAIEIEFENDNMIYYVNSIFVKGFDWEEFLEISEPGDAMVILYKVFNNKRRNIYYAEVNGVILLSQEEALKAHHDNARVGWLLTIIFGLIALAGLIYYPFYRFVIYKKRKDREIFDLSLANIEA